MPIYCFLHKPTNHLQKVSSDTPQKALTRIVSQFWKGTERRDWELVWEDSEERTYDYAPSNYWPNFLGIPYRRVGFVVKFQQRNP